MLRLLSASLLLAPAAGFNLAARVPKTLATCDARRSSDAVARLGFLQDDISYYLGHGRGR